MGYNDALQLQLELEGGYTYSNDPEDPGGATYAGLTLRQLEEQDPELAKKFPHLSNAEVGSYYWKYYWNTIPPLKAQVEMPEPADAILFQIACNMGVGRAIMLLQACLLVKPDGQWGPESAAALKYVSGPELTARLLAAQMTFYATHPQAETRGLVNRVMKVKESDVYRGKGNIRL